jgi:hypothetical protein
MKLVQRLLPMSSESFVLPSPMYEHIDQIIQDSNFSHFMKQLHTHTEDR